MPGSPKQQQETDEELIDRARRGETRCFAGLVCRHQDAVYGMALRFVRRPPDAEDIAQEAFLRAFRGLQGFRGSARFSTWLYRITWNLCTDWLRKNRKIGRGTVAVEDAGELADGRTDLEKGLLAAEEKRKVREAIDGLGEKYAAVIVLFYDQKLPVDQIASVLELPMKTVETRLYRARRRLRMLLRRSGLGEGAE